MPPAHDTHNSRVTMELFIGPPHTTLVVMFDNVRRVLPHYIPSEGLPDGIPLVQSIALVEEFLDRSGELHPDNPHYRGQIPSGRLDAGEYFTVVPVGESPSMYPSRPMVLHKMYQPKRNVRQLWFVRQGYRWFVIGYRPFAEHRFWSLTTSHSDDVVPEILVHDELVVDDGRISFRGGDEAPGVRPDLVYHGQTGRQSSLDRLRSNLEYERMQLQPQS